MSPEPRAGLPGDERHTQDTHEGAPCNRTSSNLWFDGNAEDAAQFYVSLFENSSITAVLPYGPNTPGEQGSTMLVEFELQGRGYAAINGGPQFPFTEATSFEVRCDTQQEIDRLWAALCDGGQPGQCGWLKDRFGYSWQIGSVDLSRMLLDPDTDKVDRVTQAFLRVDGEPFDVATLRAALDGAPTG